MVAQTNTKELNAVEIRFDTGDLFTNQKTIETKLHWVILRSPLLRIHYYQLQAVTSIRNLTNLLAYSEIPT